MRGFHVGLTWAMRRGRAWGTVWGTMTSDPFRLLTYKALAEFWGISRPAAEERVRRAGWPKRPGNDRSVLVEVPLSVLEAQGQEPAPDAASILADVRAEREREMQDLRDRLAQAEAAREHAEGERDEARRQTTEQREARLLAEGETKGMREAVDVAERGRRDAEARATEAQAQAAQARTEAGAAERTAAEARAKAEAAQSRLDAFQALPWWRRLTTRP
jgi:hypothetical protein